MEVITPFEPPPPNDNEIVYRPTPTGKLFHKSDAFVRLIIGPIGSGKSVASCWEIFRKAIKQKAHTDGVRRSRWVIVRNTYRELIDTTINTYNDWFSSIGYWRKMDMKHVVQMNLEDGTRAEYEVLFRALDKPDDIKKLLSLELTGGFLNEAREIPKAVLDMLVGRVGRYPSPMQGGASWWGVIMDTNPPDSDHWIVELFEENLPDEYAIFHQPSGLSEEAENIINLPNRYYERMSLGKDPEWIKVYVHGEYGFISDGIPVMPEFHQHRHVSKTRIEFDERGSDNTLYIGVDFGRTPAATFGQEIDGQMQIIDELVTIGIGATAFSSALRERIKGYYPGAHVIATGDPAGDNPGEQIDDTCIDILRNAGIPIDPAHSNNFTLRREAVSIPLTSLNMQGEPQLIISPNCINLIKGMNGGYKYKRMQVSGERYQMKPDKNKFSHVCESLQYLLLGAGRGYDVVTSASDIGKFKVIGALKSA